MQSLWCCHQIFTKSVAQVHVYHTEGTLALREGTKVHIDVLPLGVLLSHLVLRLGIDVDAKRLMADNFRALITIAWIICCSFFHCLQFTFSCRAHTLWYCIVQIHLSILLME